MQFLEELGAAASGKEKGKITTKETCDLVFLWHFLHRQTTQTQRSKIASSLQEVFATKDIMQLVTVVKSFL